MIFLCSDFIQTFYFYFNWGKYRDENSFDSWNIDTKVSFFLQCSKMQFITFQNFHIQTWFSQFLWFFSLKCWFKGQMMSKIHLSLPNAYKLMCFDRKINGRDVKFLECDYLLVQRCVKLTLGTSPMPKQETIFSIIGLQR